MSMSERNLLVAVRMSQREREALKMLATEQHRNVSETLRWLLHMACQGRQELEPEPAKPSPGEARRD